MIGFLLKKTLYDLWDNLPRLVLLNLGFYASAAAPLLLPGALDFFPPLAWAALVLGVLWCCVYLAAAARCVRNISDYGIFGFGDFFRGLKAALPSGLVLGILVIIALFIITVVIPFYGSWESGGVFIAAALFWSVAAGIIAFQFYPASGVRLDRKALPAIKRCFFFFLDNTPFCVFCLVFAALLLPLSVLAGFLVPGPAGMLLFHDEALRLRLLKYDWLEENPSAKRSRIPWDALLIDEREKTGHRTLKGFIFPWKE
jgi:hypothetical protein